MLGVALRGFCWSAASQATTFRLGTQAVPALGPTVCHSNWFVPCPALQSRLAVVDGRIAALEAELAALKSEAGDLRARRSAAAQHHALRLQQIRRGKGETGASPEEIAAALQVRSPALWGRKTESHAGPGDGREGCAARAARAALGSMDSMQFIAAQPCSPKPPAKLPLRACRAAWAQWRA